MQRVLPFGIENTKVDKLLSACTFKGATVENIPKIEKIDEEVSKVSSFITFDTVCAFICETLDMDIFSEETIMPTKGTDKQFQINRSIDVLNNVHTEGTMTLVSDNTSKVVDKIGRFYPILVFYKLVIITEKPHPDGLVIERGYIPKTKLRTMPKEFTEGLFKYNNGYVDFV